MADFSGQMYAESAQLLLAGSRQVSAVPLTAEVHRMNNVTTHQFDCKRRHPHIPYPIISWWVSVEGSLRTATIRVLTTQPGQVAE